MGKRTTKNGQKSNRLLYAVMAIIGIALFAVTSWAAQKMFETETYYVLNQDVATRTLVTPEMLSPVVVSKGGAPEAAATISDIQGGDYYTQYPLQSGDILTHSNIGTLEDISVGIPDSWVVTNFSVDADSAVGGRIKRGTYFDMMVADANGSFYPFVNVLALDTTVNLSSASSADAADTSEAHEGQTTQYVVGMSPEDAAKLQSVMQMYSGSIKLVLSPRQNEYEKPDLHAYDGIFSYNPSDGTIWPGEGTNGNELTNNSFQDVKRDDNGRPVEETDPSLIGNSKVSSSGTSSSNQTDSSTTTEGETGEQSGN